MIRLPNCPRCGQPPWLVMSEAQSFCSSDDCRVVCWDPRCTLEEFEASAVEVNIDLGRQT